MVIVIMGVSGVGKTHIGKIVAKKLEMPFYDADDFHPDENVQKMADGIALNDDDRWPWLDTLANNINDWNTYGGAVLACSALKVEYRSKMSSRTDKVAFVMLKADKQMIYDRMKKRSHYMPASLLDSQISTLEEVDEDHTVLNDGSPESVADKVLAVLKRL